MPAAGVASACVSLIAELIVKRRFAIVAPLAKAAATSAAQVMSKLSVDRAPRPSCTVAV